MASATITKAGVPADLALPLQLDVAAVKGELAEYVAPVTKVADDDPQRAKARKMAATIIGVQPGQYEQAKSAIDNAGRNLMQGSTRQSDMLRSRLGDLMKSSEDGSPVALSLIELRDKVSDLDPAGINFTPGGFARLFYKLPFVGSPIAGYFNRFETGQGAIGSIVKSLKSGRATLENDNRILGDDQVRYRETTLQLREQIAYLQTVAEELEIQIHGVEDESHKRFVENEILFPLNQRIQDLLQRLAVNQQGVISSEILIRNNRELIRGVDRGLYVTVDALNIAVASALALNNQKMVLDAVEGLNTTTNTLIANNATRLRTQGVEIQKQASSAMLDAEVLKQAFGDLSAALDDISQFRRDGLTKMRKQIEMMSVEAGKAERAITEMEGGNTAITNLPFTLDVVPEAA